MTDEQIPPTEPTPEQPAADDGASPEGSTTSEGREWLAQLQQMIDQIAAHAAPVARDVAAKAAELAAVAGEKAGPLAKRAAEKTEEVGARVADRSRRFADEIRHHAEGEASTAEDGGSGPDAAAPHDNNNAGA
jgi:hypothetical protein